ncbi:hypothetical protein MIND_00108000 [Mycena indigotica]|uniref:Uncharacterized protein n=1 Tax=Mycena indigotica TaxID=2126181 RepID=A0A8H6WEP5_9AGAR|nr:uncharacterized protein MIND_00108000 [Mycena indigotica]KAF7315914.1 hypothetical protein MIND_00108000 [Mycena indigotica]
MAIECSAPAVSPTPLYPQPPSSPPVDVKRLSRSKPNHRHTQSLGLLSPIPSRESLRDPDHNAASTSQLPSPHKSTPHFAERTSLPPMLATFFHSDSMTELDEAPRPSSRSSSRQSLPQTHSYFAPNTPQQAYSGKDHRHHPINKSPAASPSSQSRLLALSQLEGTSRTPIREQDPEHEILKARLERVLSASGATTLSSRRTSSQSVNSLFKEQDKGDTVKRRRTTDFTDENAKTIRMTPPSRRPEELARSTTTSPCASPIRHMFVSTPSSPRQSSFNKPPRRSTYRSAESSPSVRARTQSHTSPSEAKSRIRRNSAITMVSAYSTPGSTPPLFTDARDESASETEEDWDNSRINTPPLPGNDHCVGWSTFNARKAAAECRQLDGYVSFAAVEGLGEPPSPGPRVSDEEAENARRPPKRSSLGAGIVGLWRGSFW